MYDIEDDVFTIVATALRDKFPGIYVTGAYEIKPPSFPAVYIIESDNYVVKEASTLNLENAAHLMYSVSVFSNKTGFKKSEAKSIYKCVDDQMREIGFTRISKREVPNYADSTIYRLEGQYEAVVGDALEEGSFLIYQEF